ncbi:MAG: phosphopantothenoylcysteine decarboxylase, partial [Acidobacteriota bacterium]
MGFALAAEAARRGARTTLVAGPVALATPAGVDRVDVSTALEMQAAIQAQAAEADLIVMAAAVADFRPAEPASRKLKKSGGVPRIELVQNPDILAGLPAIASQALLVGFAAETEPSVEEAYAKLQRKGADLLVWNDVSRADIGFGAEHNEVTVYRRAGEPTDLSRRPKSELATALMDLFEEALRTREAAS